MSASALRSVAPASPADVWHAVLRPDVELSPAFCAELSARMRAARLTFGERIHCPFLRPFFLSEQDERRVREVAETIAELGERIMATALRSPAGPGYAETLAEIFRALPVMARFEERFSVRMYPLMAALLDALLASYREWGGTSATPVIAIVDWREVPTWSEFEIIQARFKKLGVATLVCDPRELEFDGRTLAAQGRKIDLVYRRVLINDIVARPAECAALVRAYEARAVCVANSLRCKIPHKKAFFAVLTDERNRELFTPAERELIQRHVPWTRLLGDVKTT